ncbi:hypothetical protein CR513_00059, partial [Mucuna pruriens]
MLDAYQELLSNSSNLSLGYKELKRKFSKLTKDFVSLEKENSILKKENEKLKEEHTNDLSKVNTSEDADPMTVESVQKDHPKGPSKPLRINPKESKKILVPKSMIIPVADVFNNRKQTLVMVPRQWVLT